MNRKTYKYLFFDLDHTLWDFETNAKEAMRLAFGINQLHEKGIDDFDGFFARYSHHNAILWDRYTKGLIKQEELRWKRMWRAMVEYKIGDEKLARKMSEDFLEELPNQKNVFPYTFEILDYLKEKNYPLSLITNGFNAVQAKKLKSSGLEKYFDHVITSERSNSLKPKKEIFEYAITTTCCAMCDSIMIGDNLDADISGALGCGMDAVFVNHINAEPGDIQPTYTITHLKELEEIF